MNIISGMHRSQDQITVRRTFWETALVPTFSSLGLDAASWWRALDQFPKCFNRFLINSLFGTGGKPYHFRNGVPPLVPAQLDNYLAVLSFHLQS